MRSACKKKYCIILAVGSSLFLHPTYGDNAPTPTFSEFKPQFYAGLSIGAQRLSGRRTEVVDYESSPGDPFGTPAEIISFSNGRPITNKNGYYSAHGGCRWDIPRTVFFWGPEIYIGQGNTKNNLLKETPIDMVLGTNRILTTSLQQSTFIGCNLQVGFNWISNSKLTILLGVERSQFEYKGIYEPRSQYALKLFNPAGPGPFIDFPVTAINTSKWLNGFAWGFGIEKQIESFRIGVEFRMIHYKRFKAFYEALAAEPETLYTTIKPKNIRFGLKFSYIL